MKAEIKYIALLYFANISILPAVFMFFAGTLDPKVIIPMAMLAACASTVSLGVLILWINEENIVFLTKDTLVNGVSIGPNGRPND